MKVTLCRLIFAIIIIGCTYEGKESYPSPHSEIYKWYRKASIYKKEGKKLADFDVVFLSCSLLKKIEHFARVKERLSALEAQELEEEYFYSCQTYYQFILFIRSEYPYFEDNLDLWNIFLAAKGVILKPYKIVKDSLTEEERRFFSHLTEGQTKVYKIFFIRAGLSDVENIHLEIWGIMGRVGFSWKLR